MNKFFTVKGKGIFLLGALLLALAITGGVFAYGFINASTSFTVTAKTSDFANVARNTDNAVAWTTYGRFRGDITGPVTLFNVDTSTSTYAGDLVVTVSISNADQLSKVYRVLALKLEMVKVSDNSTIDINESGVGDDDYVLLTLNNGSVDMFPGGASDNFGVRLVSGFYITHIYQGAKWLTGYEDPALFCEVAQR